MGSVDNHPPSSPTLKTPWIEVPLIRSSALSIASFCDVHLKLDYLQPSGSFKSRGVGNLILQTLIRHQKLHHNQPSDAEVRRFQPSEENHHDEAIPTTNAAPRPHFYCSSGGNAGLACVTAAKTLNCAATVVVPLSTSPLMISKIRLAGAADVIQTGASWADADRYLREHFLGHNKSKDIDNSPSTSNDPAEGEKEIPEEIGYYVPPFDHPDVWSGNATLVHELPSKPDVLICSVGGGGLLCGIMQGLESRGWLGQVDVVAVETEGAASLAASLKAGRLVTLDKITSIANSLGAVRVAERAFEWASMPGARVTSVVLSDRDAVDGMARLADDERILVEPACAICASVCYGANEGLRRLVPGLKEDAMVVVVACGGSNVTLEKIRDWKVQFDV